MTYNDLVSGKKFSLKRCLWGRVFLKKKKKDTDNTIFRMDMRIQRSLGTT